MEGYDDLSDKTDDSHQPRDVARQVRDAQADTRRTVQALPAY